jgi:hypothetical protein
MREWIRDRENAIGVLRAMLILAMGLSLVGCGSKKPEPASATTASAVEPDTRDVAKLTAWRMQHYGTPDLIAEIRPDGVPLYLRPKLGMKPDSADTMQVYYYLDQNKAISFVRGREPQTQALTPEVAAAMRDLANGPGH